MKLLGYGMPCLIARLLPQNLTLLKFDFPGAATRFERPQHQTTGNENHLENEYVPYFFK